MGSARQSSPTRHRPMGMLTPSSELPSVNARMEQHRRDCIRKSHQQKLKEVVSRIDNKPVRPYPHVAANLKGQQSRAEEAARIQKANELLVHKLKFIARPRPHSDNLSYCSRRGIRLTPSQAPVLDNEKSLRFVHAEPVTLKTRRDELQRIAHDNVRIGTRLHQQRSTYSRIQFHQTASDQIKYAENCRKFRAYSRSDSRASSTSGSLCGSPISKADFLSPSRPWADRTFSRTTSFSGAFSRTTSFSGAYSRSKSLPSSDLGKHFDRLERIGSAKMPNIRPTSQTGSPRSPYARTFSPEDPGPRPFTIDGTGIGEL